MGLNSKRRSASRRLVLSREPRAENREQRTTHQEQRAESREPYRLCVVWVQVLAAGGLEAWVRSTAALRANFELRGAKTSFAAIVLIESNKLGLVSSSSHAPSSEPASLPRVKLSAACTFDKFVVSLESDCLLAGG